jgi:hypothetical protein
MSLAVGGPHDSKNLLHECVRPLHVSVSRARLTVRPIDSQVFPEEGTRDSQMRKRISRHHDAHVRVQNACAEHRAFCDATPGGGTTPALLGTHVDDVAPLLALQERSNDDRRAATGNANAVSSVSAPMKIGV